MVDFTKKNIREQILTEATFARPATYELLTFFHALETQTDELSGQFVPITTVNPIRPSETQIFAVGVLPPSAEVTGRLLDRSASVNAQLGAAGQVESEQEVMARGGYKVSPDSTQHTTGGYGGIGSSTTVPEGPTSYSRISGAGEERFWSKLVIMSNRLGVQPENVAMVMKSESGLKSSAVSKVSNAKGLIQLTASSAPGAGLTPEQFANFENLSREQQLDAVEEYFRAGNGGPSRIQGKTAAEIKAMVFGGFNNPDGSLYNSLAGTPGYENYPRSEKQLRNYNSNREIDLDKDGIITPEELFERSAKRATLSKSQLAAIAKARRRLGMAEDPAPVRPNANSSTDFQKVGSKEASESRRVQAQTSDTSLNRVGLGRRYSLAQDAQARATQAALKQIAAMPPLRLLVNPQSFRQSMDKVIVDNWGRNGPIVEHWGDNQDRIEGSGKIAAYYSLDAQPQFNQNGSVGNSPGLGRTARQFSASYQNLLSLWLLYKNNGGIWFPDNFPDSNSSKKMNLSLVGSIYIYFDSILYIGSFDSFNLTESETEPYTLEYNFSFTVRAYFELDNLEAQSFTYGSDLLSNLRRNQTQLQSTASASLTASNVNTEASVPLPYDPLEDDPLAGINDDISGDDPLGSFGAV